MILTRIKRELPLKNWALAIARKVGSVKARAALARKLSVILETYNEIPAEAPLAPSDPGRAMDRCHPYDFPESTYFCVAANAASTSTISGLFRPALRRSPKSSSTFFSQGVARFVANSFPRLPK